MFALPESTPSRQAFSRYTKRHPDKIPSIPPRGLLGIFFVGRFSDPGTLCYFGFSLKLVATSEKSPTV